MQVFVFALDSNLNVNWNPADSNGVFLQYNNISVPYSYYYEDTTTQWSNVDVYYLSPADISITVNTLNNPNPDSTSTSVWFTGFNAFWPLDQNNSNHSQFQSNHVKPVPVSVIAMTIKDSKIYAGILTVASLIANGVYDITMQEMSETELKNAIAALN
jgi:hypothetical protein